MKIICKAGHSCSLDEDAELRVMQWVSHHLTQSMTYTNGDATVRRGNITPLALYPDSFWQDYEKESCREFTEL